MSTAIEWTDETWNPITGCSAISEGCANCYAKRMANRLKGRCGYDADEPFKVTVHHDRLEQPLKWRDPRRVFVCSMGDLFHEDVPDDFRARVFARMGYPSRHVFQVLTKRPDRMLAFVRDFEANCGVWVDEFPTVWLGVTAENQARADERIPLLLKAPAAVHFVSVEPMLGPVSLRARLGDPTGPSLDWVICGAETGPGARAMKPIWALDLYEQCKAAAVPFFFKKWSAGERPYPMPREFPKEVKR